MVNDKDRTDNTIQLKDGRTLGYAEYGDPKGKPIFFFHGWPGSFPRFLVAPLQDPCLARQAFAGQTPAGQRFLA